MATDFLGIWFDTSVWIQHLGRTEPRLTALLADGQVLIHPFVVGELACGTLKRRQEVLSWIGHLDAAPSASDGEAFRLIEERCPRGRSLGWADGYLLASCLLAGVRLWSLDLRLARAAETLGLAA
jgi:hypothetical protein